MVSLEAYTLGARTWPFSTMPLCASVLHLVHVSTHTRICHVFISAAYILYFELEDLCIVCVSSYVVNAVLFLLLLPTSDSAAHTKHKKQN